MTGNTLTTEAGDKGTQALGTVQKEGEDDINFYVKQSILNILNYEMTEIFASLGVNTNGGEFFFVPPMSKNSQEKVNVLKTLKNDMLLPIDDDYLYEEFGIPKPMNYEALKAELVKARTAPSSCRLQGMIRMNRTIWTTTANQMMSMTVKMVTAILMTTNPEIAGRKNWTKNGRKITPSTGCSVFSQKPCRAAGRIQTGSRCPVRGCP